MYFEAKDFYIAIAEYSDADDIAEVYNSNEAFLLNHTGSNSITREWLLEELKAMKEMGFSPCKIVERLSGKIIGVIDFKPGEEAYLSLLMLHKDYKSKGFGRIAYQTFEEYIKAMQSKCIRIDVVTNYDSSVLDFWSKNGFNQIKTIELNWTGKVLPAVVMKKSLCP